MFYTVNKAFAHAFQAATHFVKALSSTVVKIPTMWLHMYNYDKFVSMVCLFLAQFRTEMTNEIPRLVLLVTHKKIRGVSNATVV